MAQPDEAQPAQNGIPDFVPQQRVLGTARKHVQDRGGRKVLIINHIAGSEMILCAFEDDEAERVSAELKPSRVARTNGAGPTGLVIP